MIKSFEVPQSNKLKNFQLSAHSYIKFSNNVSALNVVSTLQNIPFNQSLSPSLNGNGYRFDKSQLTKFNAGSNIKAIMPSCFIKCQNLTETTFKGEIDTIGDYAFYGCTKLKNVSLLTSDHAANSIGDYAFAMTGIEKAKIGIDGRTSTASIYGKCMFANCDELKSVEFSESNNVSEKMFLNDTSLTSVKFSSTTNCMQSNAFEKCTALKTIEMPADIYTVPEQFMKDCESLTSFSFKEPGRLAYNQTLGNDMLNGTAIESLTFPASLTSLNAFSTNTLRGMDNLKEIHFNGMSYEQLATVVAQTPDEPEEEPEQDKPESEIDIPYETTKIYYEDSLDRLMDYCGITNEYKNSMLIRQSSVQLYEMINKCLDMHIPFIVFVSCSEFIKEKKSYRPRCSNCQNFIAGTLPNNEFKNFVQNNGIYVIMIISEGTYSYNNNYVRKNVLLLDDFTWVVQDIIWKKQDGPLFNNPHVIRYKIEGMANAVETYLYRISVFTQQNNLKNANISVQTGIISKVNFTITSTNCFGLNHNVKLFSKDGKCIEFESSGSGGAIVYNQEVQIDKLTVNDFRYGQWYAQAQLLKVYADSNYIPVLAILTQGNDFKQSSMFNNTIFNNSEFQNQITSKSLLLCKLDSSSMSSGNPAFLLRTWMDKASFSNFPLLMVYWMRQNGSVSIIDSNQKYNEALVDFAYFSSNLADDDIDGVECVHSTQDIVEWIDSLESLKLYVPQSNFQRPEIKEFLSQYPRYKKYQNQVDDDYGRYYPVATLGPKTQSSYTVQVDNGSGYVAEYQISPSTQPMSLPPAGTYQYFSLLSTDENASIYESVYQISGLIFKTGNEQTSYYIREDSYAYQAKTYNAYLTDIGISQSNVNKTLRAFRYDLYLEDDDGNPTLSIDEDEGIPPLWNDYVSLTLNAGTKVNEKDATTVNIWLSSSAELTIEPPDPDEPNAPPDVDINPSTPQYVISAQVVGIQNGAMKLQWVREFNNE